MSGPSADGEQLDPTEDEPQAGPAGYGATLDLTQEEPHAPPVPLVSASEYVLDLTQEEPQASASPKVTVTQALAPESRQLEDYTRIALAGALVGLLAVVTLVPGFYIATYPSKEAAIESFLKLVFTPIVGLVGSVVGFYFGARTAGGGGG
jgi:hypothetical protein